jgi:hypothetical protein
MEESGEIDLSGNRVIHVVLSHLTPGQSMPRGGIAGLYHEVGNDTVPQHPVIKSLTHQLQEIVTMLRCLVIEIHHDITLRRLQQNLMARHGAVGCRARRFSLPPYCEMYGNQRQNGNPFAHILYSFFNQRCKIKKKQTHLILKFPNNIKF